MRDRTALYPHHVGPVTEEGERVAICTAQRNRHSTECVLQSGRFSFCSTVRGVRGCTALLAAGFPSG